MADTKALTTKELSHSQRFTEMVLREYNNVPGGLALTDYQKELIQHYFVKTDAVLKKADQDRMAKNEKNSDHKYDNALACTWQNVNLDQMAQDVVHFSKLGLDPTMKNHLHVVPYKNKATQKYDVGFIIGYEGKQYVALEYAINKPTGLVYDLVWSNDIFKAIKKGPGVEVESYQFDIPCPFDRGEIVGGFFYTMYADPKNNKLIIMSKKDIDKRKPAYASAEFWGGEKDKYENGKKAGKEIIPGWYEEMALKTVVRHGCDSIALDPKKVNVSLTYVQERQTELEAQQVDSEIAANANATVLDVEVEPTDGQQKIEGVE